MNNDEEIDGLLRLKYLYLILYYHLYGERKESNKFDECLWKIKKITKF